MLSILIPCFDYNAYPLVCEIEKQAVSLKIKFEIICIDDASFSLKNENNQKINSIPNAKFIESKKNIGRIRNRMLLAETAQFDWLIFVDVDTTPRNKDFLKNYIACKNKGVFVFGGRQFDEKSKIKGGSLRYKFSKKREEINAIGRNKNPYKFISSSNFMTQKSKIIDVLKKITNNSYGNDYIFGALLKSQSTEVVHIDNPVAVNETDSNEVFIEKTKNALKNLIENKKNKKISQHSISILKTYSLLKFFHLTSVFLKITNLLETNLENNLKVENPNLFLFDLFRLRYICSLSNN